MRFAHRLRQFAVSFSVIISAFVGASLSELSADPLVQFLFWDSVGDQLGNSAKAYEEYRNERAKWKKEAAKARAKLEACGGCPEAQAEVDKWQDVESQFQAWAGRAAYVSKMPPNVAKFLGIDYDGFPPPKTFEEKFASGEGIVPLSKPWMDDAPAFCQSAAKSHLQCARSYQMENRTTFISHLFAPGGQCYDSAVLYHACQAKDYDAFDDAVARQMARKSGMIVAEFEPDTFVDPVPRPETGLIYYGAVPDDFVPPALPVDYVKERLAEPTVRQVHIMMKKHGAGNLINVVVGPWDSENVRQQAQSCTGAGKAERQPEEVRRFCEDLYEIRGRGETPLTLMCVYSSNSGPAQRVDFWYDERKDLADPKNLLKRNAQHPMATAFLGAATQCPDNIEQVASIKGEYHARLNQIRAANPQIPGTEHLPASKWLQDQWKKWEAEAAAYQARLDYTASLPAYGVYEFAFVSRVFNDVGHPELKNLTGKCVIAPALSLASIGCQSQEGGYVAKGMVQHPAQFSFSWQQGPLALSGVSMVAENVGSNVLTSSTGREKDSIYYRPEHEENRLVRTGDLIPFGDYHVLGTYEVTLQNEDENKSLTCVVAPDAANNPRFMECIDGNNVRSRLGSFLPVEQTNQDGETLPVYSLELNILSEQTVSQYDQWTGGNYVKVGGAFFSRSAFVVVDPSFSGDDISQAPLLIFGENNIGGTMKRLSGDEFAKKDTLTYCTAALVEGTYETGFGDMQCQKNGDDLSCCYGENGCDNILDLKFSSNRYAMAGYWKKPDNTNGGAAFTLDGDCSLVNGVWYDSRSTQIDYWEVWERKLAPSKAQCSVGDASGSYDIGGDVMECSQVNGALECRYGEDGTHSNKLTLKKASGQNVLKGNWRGYTEEKSEPTQFSVDDNCDVTSGSIWQVGQRTPLPGKAIVKRKDGEVCASKHMEGLYQSNRGPLECRAEGDKLKCCQSDAAECDRYADLNLTFNGNRLDGKWIVLPKPAKASASFTLNESCKIANGFTSVYNSMEPKLWQIVASAGSSAGGSQDDDAGNTNMKLSQVKNEISAKSSGLSIAESASASANLALGKTVTASDVGYGWTPDRAVDGDNETGYHSSTDDVHDHWMEVDLGGPQNFQRIELVNRLEYLPRLDGAIVIALSDDRQALFTSDPVSGSPPVFRLDGDFKKVRYIRVEHTGSNLTVMELRALRLQ